MSPEEVLYDLQITKFASAAALVVLLYDHILTFPDEVAFVWKTKVSVPKILFLVSRYLVPCAVILHSYDQSGLSGRDLSNNFCRIYITASLYIGMFSIAVSNLLVLLRLWVLWDETEYSLRLRVWTLGLFVLTLTAMLVILSFTAVQIFPMIVYDKTMHMCVFSKSPRIAYMWIPGLVFEVMVFLTTWWNMLDRPRTADSPVSRALYRDGAIYFFVIFVFRIANFVLALAAPRPFIFLGIFLLWSFSNITLGHLVINCRKIASPSPSLTFYTVSNAWEEGTVLHIQAPERAPTAMSFMTGDLELSKFNKNGLDDDDDEGPDWQGRDVWGQV